jgi:hypothetical protein
MSVRLPQYIAMAPTLVREPFHRDGCVYEEEGRRLADSRLQVRRPHPPGEPERPGPHQALRRPGGRGREAVPAHAVLDGEVAIEDQQLRSRFDWLREPDPAAVASPPQSWPSTCCTTSAVT